MDMQMPGMDGLETAARIRTLPEGKHLPVIAVTANALPGDRERYLAGGLDDYLAKPIDPRELHQMLLHWQPKKDNRTPPVTPATDASACADEFESLREAGINTAKALGHLLGDGVLYRQLLERFVNERSNLPEQLNRAQRQGQTLQIRDTIHSLRSLAATLGLETLATLAARAEQQLVEGAAPPDIDELNIQFRRDLTLLRAWLDQNGPAHSEQT